MQSSRTIWLIAVSALLIFGVVVVTLRAAEQADPLAAAPTHTPATPTNAAAASKGTPSALPIPPPAPAPEETATISDDPMTAPDPSQSADNSVSFPADI
jgi:hypothetical protein